MSKEQKNYEEEIVDVTSDGKVKIRTHGIREMKDGDEVVGEQVQEQEYTVPLQALKSRVDNKAQEVNRIKEQLHEAEAKRSRYGEKRELTAFEKKIHKALQSVNEQQQIEKLDQQIENHQEMFLRAREQMSQMRDTVKEAEDKLGVQSDE